MNDSNIRLVAMMASLLTITPCSVASQEAGQQSAQTSTTTAEFTHNYLLYLPKNYSNGEKHPLLLFLHGAGERGNNELDKVKTHGPPKLIAQGKDFPFMVVSPQCEKDSWWDSASLKSLLDHIEAKYRVDKKRIYVTGLSMGGYGTWALALHQPDRFAAIAPICGGGNDIAARYQKPIQAAVWAFHGAKDVVVPLKKSEEMVKALKERKVSAKLTVYPDANHNSWTETYNNVKLYDWFLEHRKP